MRSTDWKSSLQRILSKYNGINEFALDVTFSFVLQNQVDEMGSFSSKTRAVRDVGNLRKESKEEISRGVGDKRFPTTDSNELVKNTATQGQASHSTVNASEMTENITRPGQAGAANGGEPKACCSQEQHTDPGTDPKVRRPSFSWLVSSDVLKTKGKKQC